MNEAQCPGIVVAAPADLDRVAAAYATAFADEAVVAWAFPDGALSTVRHAAAITESLRTGEVLVAELPGGTIAGVSTWLTVRSTEQLHQEAATLTDLAASAPELARIATVLRLVTDRHPTAPHLYLSSMAVVPSARGRGIGAAILRHRLTRADEEGEPAYLEASTPRNQRLYARHGFHPAGAPIELPDGPSLQPMWRSPASGTAGRS